MLFLKGRGPHKEPFHQVREAGAKRLDLDLLLEHLSDGVSAGEEAEHVQVLDVVVGSLPIASHQFLGGVDDKVAGVLGRASENL